MDVYGRDWSLEEFQEKQLKIDVVMTKGIIKQDGSHFLCARCLNEDQSRFATFIYHGSQIVYCRDCIQFGLVTNETELVRSLERPKLAPSVGELNQDFKLSSLQQQGSNAAIKALTQSERCLIWAVCGAGKTEMMFESISLALSQGKRVCWAIPRTDVVIELKPRLQAAFPNAKVVALYGASTEKSDYGDIVITTTHQLIKFYQAFEFMVIDEVDAFPYTFDAMLPRLVKKACAAKCGIVYLSATPTPNDQQAIKTGALTCCLIPARYHLHRLDVPRFKFCGNWKGALSRGRVPWRFRHWIHKKRADKRRALLFVPTISCGENLKSILTRQKMSVEFVHANDDERASKVKQFKEGQYEFLITTMILERGVTIVDIDVGILGAEDEVFLESALVQISGRVGRHPKYPHGEIIFFHNGVTHEMVKAREQIERMNKAAKKQNLLVD